MTGRIWCFILVSALLAACNSSRDNNNGGGGPAGTLQVSGSAVKGPLSAGTLEIFEGLDRFGGATLQGRQQSSIDSAGRFDTTFTRAAAATGAFVTCCAFGTFRDEVRNDEQTFGLEDALYRVFIDSGAAQKVASLTVITTMIYQHTRYLRTVFPHHTDAQVLANAERRFANLFGMVDPNAVPNRNGNADERIALHVSTMFSAYANGLGLPTALLLRLLASDAADGKFDGLAFGCPIPTGAGDLPTSALIDAKNTWLILLDSPGSTTTRDDPDVQTLCAAIAARTVGDTACMDEIPRIEAIRPAQGALYGVRLRVETTVPVSFSLNEVDFTQVSSTPTPNGFELQFDEPVGPSSLGDGVVPYKVMNDAGLADHGWIPLHRQLALAGYAPNEIPWAGGTRVIIDGEFPIDQEYTVLFGSKPAVEVCRIDGTTLTAYPAPNADGDPASVPVTVNGQTVPGGNMRFRAGGLTSADRRRLVATSLTFTDDGDLDATHTTLNLDNSVSGTRFRISNGDLTTSPIEGTTSYHTGPDGTAELGDLFFPSKGQFNEAEDFAVFSRDGNGGTGIGFGAVDQPVTLNGKRYFTGVAADAEGTWQVRGQADFNSGRVDVWGNVSNGPATIPLFATANYTLSGARMDFTNVAGAGITGAVGTTSGEYGSVILTGPRILVILVFAPNIVPIAPTARASSVVGAELRFHPDRVEMKRSAIVMRRLGDRLPHGGLKCDIRCPVFFDFGVAFGPWDESLSSLLLYIAGAGAVRDPDGNDFGCVVGNGAFLASPRSGGLGFGLYFPKTEYFTPFSMPCAYKVLATGMAIGENESPYFEWSQRLGTAVPEPVGLQLFEETPAINVATKFRFDTIKTKDLVRDDEREVTVVNGGATSDEGYAFAFVNNQLVAFPCDGLEGGGTFCLWKGWLKWDGESGTLGSTTGFGTPWCAAFVKESESAPTPSGAYDVRFFSTQVLPSNIFAINGTGTSTWGGGTMTLDYTQIAKAELGGDPITGGTPPNTTGVYTITADGCIDPLTIDFDGFESDFCGIVDRKANTMYIMSLGGLGGLYVYSRDGAGTVTGQTNLCGLELDFPGAPIIEIGVRSGSLRLRPSTADAFFERVIWNNGFEAMVRVERDFFPGFAITQSARDYMGTMTTGRDLAGEVGVGGNGAQAENGTGAPSGGIDLTRTRE